MNNLLSKLAKLDKFLYQVQKPGRYTGGEWNIIRKDWDKTPIRTAIIYPDLYEIGMSNMALPILYDILNSQPDVLAERAFAPWTDMEAIMRAEGIPLFSLESRRPLQDFDIIGFSLGYELTYTNVLNMLDLAGIPPLAAERNDSHPLIIAGGSCVLNPEPMSDFIDAFNIGDGEETLPDILNAFRECRGQGKERLLRRLAEIPGVYVPRFYEVAYAANGAVSSITPTAPEAPPVIKRRVVTELPKPVTKPVVPFLEVIHDRGAVEIQRGCTHGCRFCQAGIIYRNLRERQPEEILHAVDEIISNCGYNEIALVSLSSGDYSHLNEVVSLLAQRHPDISLSLPSLYINSVTIELLDKLQSQKKTGLTFAPEAGSERLRHIINKNISEEELLKTAAAAFERGWTGIKLYFMLGLPGENMDDIKDIVNLVDKMRAVGRQTKGRMPQIRITLSTFVPKPHTPFQWVAQNTDEELNAKHAVLIEGLRRKGVKFSWSNTDTSLLEATLSRGDRRLGKVIYRAWRSGAHFDSWGECFNFQHWQKAFQDEGLEPDFYARRERPLEEVLPWGHIQVGVSPEFLKREYKRSVEEKTTRDCRTENCNACGLEKSEAACQLKLAAATQNR